MIMIVIGKSMYFVFCLCVLRSKMCPLPAETPLLPSHIGVPQAQVNSRLILALLVLGALFMAFVMLARMVYRRVGPTISARAPRLPVMPLLFGLSLFSGTVLAPVAVGGWWYTRRKQASFASEPISSEMLDQAKELKAVEGSPEE